MASSSTEQRAQDLQLGEVDEQTAEDLLDQVIEGFEDDVYAQIQAFQVAKHKGEGLAMSTIAKEAKRRTDELWDSEAKRRLVCPGKDVLRRLSERLAEEGYRQISARGLARELSEAEIAAEVRSLLRRIDEDAR